MKRGCIGWSGKWQTCHLNKSLLNEAMKVEKQARISPRSHDFTSLVGETKNFLLIITQCSRCFTNNMNRESTSEGHGD